MRRKVLGSFSGAENVPDEADEAGGHQPANEENEVRCGFSPEKPCLPLSIEGKNAFLFYKSVLQQA